MALYSNQVVVSTTATKLNQDTHTGQSRKWKIAVRGTNSVYIGNSTVTTTTGFQLQKLGDGTSGTDPAMLEIDIGPDEVLYAVTSSGTTSVHVLTA